jgi:tripartite-type tricarboxylate transporter receptor subunit TctC
MTKIKLIMIAVFFAITSSAYAKPVLDVIVPSGTSGNAFAESNLISDALKGLGYDSEVVVTRNCVNNKVYMAKDTGRPGVFLRDTGRYVKDESRGCHVEVNDDSFISVFYNRNQTMCIRADEAANSIPEFLKGKTKVTVGNTATLIDGIYDDLSKDTGIKFVRVDFKGSKKTLKGLVAGDVDMMYTGFTKREISNKHIKCLAVSSPVEVGGKQPLSVVFPTWHLNKIGTLKYWHAVNIPADQRATVKADLNRIIESETVATYLKKAFMTPGTEIKDQKKAFWDIVSVLTGNKLASK